MRFSFLFGEKFSQEKLYFLEPHFPQQSYTATKQVGHLNTIGNIILILVSV